jgi:hypothetical protein
MRLPRVFCLHLPRSEKRQREKATYLHRELRQRNTKPAPAATNTSPTVSESHEVLSGPAVLLATPASSAVPATTGSGVHGVSECCVLRQNLATVRIRS